MIEIVECEFKQGKTYYFYTNSFIGDVMINLNDFTLSNNK